jgi:hypothetical protein
VRIKGLALEAAPDLFTGCLLRIHAVRTNPFNPANVHSHLIFPHSMLNCLIISTSMLSLGMSSTRSKFHLIPSDLSVQLSASFRSCALFTPSYEKRTKSDPLTPLVPITASHFFALFFTLAKISPLLATHTKNTGGYTLLRTSRRHAIPKMEPVLKPKLTLRSGFCSLRVALNSPLAGDNHASN